MLISFLLALEMFLMSWSWKDIPKCYLLRS
nr:MAG TPA: hypothetical protein [Caudoviricetes sp.]